VRRTECGVRSAGASAIALCVCLTSACFSEPVRNVTLLARGMAFALAEQPGVANPVIRVRAGERVRLILKNEAPGLVHDIAIPAWNVAADSVRTGETAQVVFTVPTTPGRAEYRCRPHAEMMNGVVDVTP
jgi:plastocyanin